VKRVVLCRPEGPRNLGSILRLMQNFGPADVVLHDVEKALSDASAAGGNRIATAGAGRVEDVRSHA